MSSSRDSNLWIHDGRGHLVRVMGNYEASLDPLGRATTPWDVTGEYALRSILLAATKENDPVAASLKEVRFREERTAEGQRLLVVEFDFQNGRRATYWLLPEFAYAIHKYEAYRETGSVSMRVDRVSYRIVENLAIPEKAVLTSFSTPDAEGKSSITTRQELSATAIDVNSDIVPESLFRLAVPTGYSLYDRDEKVHLKDPADIRKHLESISATPDDHKQPSKNVEPAKPAEVVPPPETPIAEPTDSRNWLRWGILAFGTILLVGLGFLLRSRR